MAAGFDEEKRTEPKCCKELLTSVKLALHRLLEPMVADQLMVTIHDEESSHFCCCCIGLIKAGLLQQLFVGAARSETAPTSSCAEHSSNDCNTDKK